MTLWRSGGIMHRAGGMRRACGAAVACVLVTMLAAAAPARAAAAGPAAKWSGPSVIPSAATYDGGPALAVYHGLLYAAWQGELSPYHLWYATFNGTSWSHEAQVPQAETNAYTGPTLAVYDGELYLAWQGGLSPYHIWYSAFNGTTWTTEAKVPDALVNHSSAVGLAAYNGDLYLAWTGQSAPYDLWYSAFNGTSWTTQATIPGATSTGEFAYAASPLASYGGLLYVVFPTGSNGLLEDAAFDGTWSAPAAVGDGDVLSDGGPAITVLGKKLYASWVSLIGGNPLDWSSFNAASWTKPQEVPHSTTIVNPALAGYGGKLYDAWTPDIEGSAIDYSVHS